MSYGYDDDDYYAKKNSRGGGNGYKSNRQLYNDNEKMIGDQDEILDQIIETTQLAKNEGREIQEVLQEQDPMLDNLNNKAGKNVEHITKTSEKLDNVIQKQSLWCFYLVIFGELLVLLLLFIVFP